MRTIFKIQTLILVLLLTAACSKESTPIIRVDSSSDISFKAEGGSAAVSFFSSANWTAIVSSQWCTVSQASGSKGNNSISVNCIANPSNTARECTITITAKDTYAVIHISQEERIPEPISSLIFGKWVIKKGTPTGFLSDTKFSHIINFKESGNYEETCYSAQDITNNGVNTFWESQTLTGNWKGGDNKIVLNDWDGKVLNDTLHLVSVNSSELKLKFKNTVLTYCKEDQQFANLKSDITGNWYSITTLNYKGYYFLKADGAATVISYEKFFNNYISSGYSGTWWLNNNDLILHDNKAAGGYNYTYQIFFINDKYLGFKALVLEKQ